MGRLDYFKIHARVMQGDTLQPFLFVIVLDYALRRAIHGKEEELGFTLHPRRSRRIGPESINDLDVADDIVLLSNGIEQGNNIVHSVEAECLKVGLPLIVLAEWKLSERSRKPASKTSNILTAGVPGTGI